MKTEVRLKDVIKITDEDILNAMSYTLYNMKYKEVLQSNDKEYSDFVDEFVEFIKGGRNRVIGFSIGGYQIFGIDEATLMCERFNNFKHSMHITDTFLVNEVYKDYFKVGLLNEYDKKEFQRVGKYNEILKFLDELQFPYEWEYRKFFRLGCNVAGKN